ncbi:vomeronasal type-1 receptor 3-like [Saimiri boliviensis]|uniref:vomeronasal type-1 receptor 3-like n=1 Tax=Saimiri boliviensis TaxID=27679 RepID=UPI000533FB99|nr:vomeronasal type-1 receptor 3-like [Saimiri boliviensis boliviensis]
MASRDLAIGMIFLSQMIVGCLGNFFLLHHYSFLCFTRGVLQSTDLILKHLTVANSLVLLSKGIPQTMVAFGLKDSLSDAGCKLVFYVHRVGRGVCIGNTCLLSIFQAVTISPRELRCAQLKLHAPKYTGSFNILVLCWILNMLVNVAVAVHVTGKWNSVNGTKASDYGYCSGRGGIPHLSYIVLLSFLDVLCLGLTTVASGSMVLILHRHKRQVQRIRGTNLSPRASPESRVTQSVLVLVSTFVLFYSLSSIFTLHMSLFPNPSWWLVNTSALITACFPTVSPFVLMSRDPRIPRLGSACCGRNTVS